MQRRTFLGLAGAALLGGCGEDVDKPPADAAIVAFALTLERLEVQIYRRAVLSGLFGGGELDLIRRFGRQEREHVAALTVAMRKLQAPLPRQPVLRGDLSTRIAILEAAYRLENLGAAAYLGQIPRIAGDDLRATALAIHAVEARHAATLNVLLDKDITPTGAFAKPASMRDAMAVARLFGA